MDIDIEIPDLAGMVQRYGNVGPIVQQELKRAGDRSGLAVERRAKGRAKVKTGHMRRSVTFATTLQGYAVETRVGTNVPYARFLNDGTRYIAADFWLTGSLDLERGAIRKEFANANKRIVNRVTKGG